MDTTNPTPPPVPDLPLGSAVWLLISDWTDRPCYVCDFEGVIRITNRAGEHFKTTCPACDGDKTLDYATQQLVPAVVTRRVTALRPDGTHSCQIVATEQRADPDEARQVHLRDDAFNTSWFVDIDLAHAAQVACDEAQQYVDEWTPVKD